MTSQEAKSAYSFATTGVDFDKVVAAIPAYEIGEELGRGTWGVVLAGHHRRLGRPVAIKELRAFGADPLVRARFTSEAQLLATLDHPHVVPIYDFVERDGLCLLVMERLTGGTVWDRYRDQGFSPQASCALILAVCSALHHAHQRGVLHRDIKPENLMFSSQGTLKVADFGLAKVIGGTSARVTIAGEVLGTPAYMAPEQALGADLCPATDIYAAATILYELICGQLPFPGENTPSSALYQRVHEPPRPLRQVAPNTPQILALAIDRALASSPSDRYDTAEEFGIVVAEAAAETWGPDWLDGSGVPVASGGPIVAAAFRDSRPPTSGLNTIQTPKITRPEGPRPRKDHKAVRTHSRKRPFKAFLGAVVTVVILAGVVAIPVLLRSSGHRGSAHPVVKSASPPPSLPNGWHVAKAASMVRQQVGAAKAGGILWVFGGLTPSGSTPAVEGYDTAINQWETGPDLPLPLNHLMAVTYNNEPVVIGGWVTTGSGDNGVSGRVFALRNGAWVALPALLHPRAAGAAAVVDGKIIVVGGQANGQLVTQTEIFDGTRWKDAAPIPTPRDHLTAVSDGHYLYAIGGRALSADKNLAAVERYDPATNQWRSLPALPTPRGGLGAAITGNRIITLGGETPTAVLNTVEAFDLTSNTWTTLPPMATPRHGMAVLSAGSAIYTIDGATTPGHTDSTNINQVLDFSSPEPLPPLPPPPTTVDTTVPSTVTATTTPPWRPPSTKRTPGSSVYRSTVPRTVKTTTTTKPTSNST